MIFQKTGLSARTETTPERLPTVPWKQNSARPQLWSHRRLTGVRRGIQAEHTGESIAAAEFRSDDIAVRAERFAQRGDLYLEVLFRHHDAPPHPAEELFFCDEQAIGLQQDQKEIEGARAEYDRNTVSEQLPLAQQHAETAEFESRVGCCRTRPVRAVRQWGFAEG
jgi:hypothetical protein